jgi:hypothetical protein
MRNRLDKQGERNVNHTARRKFQSVHFPDIGKKALGAGGRVGNAKVISSQKGRSDLVIDLSAVASGNGKVSGIVRTVVYGWPRSHRLQNAGGQKQKQQK